ncbi:MAG TPA: SDR family oxidoreductase [Candidatus Acidoferrales bacterium]|nr:SDR family oxidoreductase [Candidatus Acidoferrales bacterium]
MNYLVTGGAGFIGSNIVDELVRRGRRVTVLDDFSSGKEENLAGVRDKIRLLRGSICDLQAAQEACRGADYVLHLAARTSVPRSVAEPLDTNRVNIDGTLNVLVAARDAKVRRFVFAASSSAYGESETLPKVETMPSAPISPYGVTKLVGEIYAQVFGRVYGLENVSIRYFNVFGPRQDPTSQYSGVLSRFMLAVLQGVSPVVYGDGLQSRDFTYIDNVVDITLRACEAPGASGKVFNGGTGERTTLDNVLKLLSQICGKQIAAKYDPPRTGDILHSLADVSSARKLLGYSPLVNFEEGLRLTWDWYCQAYASVSTSAPGTR